MNFYNKYLKYKTKYLNLKKQIGSSEPHTIYYVPLPDSPYNSWTVNGNIVKASDINRYLSTTIGAISIDKETLLTNLNNINKCIITDGETKKLVELCNNIYHSNNIVFGVSDAEGTFAFIDIDFNKAESKNLLFISWAVSDNSNKMPGNTSHRGKGKKLISIANQMAKYFSIPYLACVPTDGSRSFWIENGFADTGEHFYAKLV
jgi:hypothetical protein